MLVLSIKYFLLEQIIRLNFLLHRFFILRPFEHIVFEVDIFCLPRHNNLFFEHIIVGIITAHVNIFLQLVYNTTLFQYPLFTLAIPRVCFFLLNLNESTLV